jgi:hypothetical protein
MFENCPIFMSGLKELEEDAVAWGVEGAMGGAGREEEDLALDNASARSVKERTRAAGLREVEAGGA